LIKFLKIFIFISQYSLISVAFFEVLKEIIRVFIGVIINMKVLSWLKEKTSSLFAWGDRNSASIYTGCFVALIMMSIMFVKDIKHTTKEVGHMVDKIELTRENNELAQASIEQFRIINDLLETSSLQRDQTEQAVETINQQTAILQKLVDYLKKIGHWPPKIAPPKPTDPDKWI